jgi:hypothetical protein
MYKLLIVDHFSLFNHKTYFYYRKQKFKIFLSLLCHINYHGDEKNATEKATTKKNKLDVNINDKQTTVGHRFLDFFFLRCESPILIYCYESV